MAQTNVRFPVPRTGETLARLTTVGVLVAIAAILFTQALVEALAVDVGATGPMSPFETIPLVGTTIIAGVGAAVVYALLIKVTDRPVRNFVVIATGVFAFMLVPVAFAAPSMGVTPVGQGILVLYHLLAAVPIVAFLIGAIRERTGRSDSTDVGF